MPEPASPERRYRGAIVGLGGIAHQSHLPALRLPAASRLEIVAAVDAAPGVVPLPGIPLFPDLSGLAGLDVDFLDICTPTASHLGLTLWALERGLHVLCEKPVAVRPEEAARIRVAAQAAHRVVMPCHQYRFNPVWRKVRRWLDEEAIGPWYLAELDVYRLAADPGAGRAATPWRGRAVDARGGVLLDHGTHLIYQLLDVAGPPSSVRAWSGRLRHAGYDVEDTAHLLFEFPGRMAKMFLTWAAHHRENRIRFIGERGTIDWTGGLLTLERDGTTETFDHAAELQKDAYAAWFADLFGAFADAMDTSDPEPLNDIARVAEVLHAAYGSGPAKRGPLVGAA
jgi:predicted dehydrogenase